MSDPIHSVTSNGEFRETIITTTTQSMTLKAILAILFGYGAGVWFTVEALRKRAAFNRAQSWPNTPGRILESALVKDSSGKYTDLRVRYEFHPGQRIEGATPRITGVWFWNNKEQAEFVARYTVGQEVEVYYDPGNPALNCLDRTDRSSIAVMWILALGGTVLASLLVWLIH